MGEIPAGEWVLHTISVGELPVVVLLPPGLPRLRSVDVDFTVETEDELRAIVAALGGIGQFAEPTRTDRLLSAHHYPASDDEVGWDVNVWLGPTLALEKPKPMAPPAVMRLLEEQAAAQQLEEVVDAS